MRSYPQLNRLTQNESKSETLFTLEDDDTGGSRFVDVRLGKIEKRNRRPRFYQLFVDDGEVRVVAYCATSVSAICL
jgi:hypothetical protein